METNIRTKEQLESAIDALEKRKDTEALELKEYFSDAYQRMKPANILKNTLSELEHNTKLRNDLIKTAVALAVGYIVKRVITAVAVNRAAGPVGTLVQAGISGYIIKNGPQLQRIAIQFLRMLFKKRLQHQEQLRLQQSTVITS